MKETIVDIEPTWTNIGRMLLRNDSDFESIKPALAIADIVRQAQKSGKKQVIFM
jgi:hypothetical protein